MNIIYLNILLITFIPFNKVLKYAAIIFCKIGMSKISDISNNSFVFCISKSLNSSLNYSVLIYLFNIYFY